MKQNLNIFDRFIRIILGAILSFSALLFFENIFAKIIVLLGGLFSLGEALFAKCFLFYHLGVKNKKQSLAKEFLYLLGLAAIQVTIAYEWFTAGWGKLSSSEFVDGIGKTLGFFASQNPFPWYKDFLMGFASRNATLFAYAVEWSQIAIGLVLAVSIVWMVYGKNRKAPIIASVLALLGGLFMNLNFYLAAGWTGPGSSGINVVMFWTQAVLVYVWLSALISKN